MSGGVERINSFLTLSILADRSFNFFVLEIESERVAAKKPLGLFTGPCVDSALFSKIRRRCLLDGCKWDPRVGDVETLVSFPLVMAGSEWRAISGQAELLASEAAEASEEIMARPELLGELGLPSTLRRVLVGRGQPAPSAGHVIRFDFHPTAQGWRISEANSDVPGGFSEGSYFTSLMAGQFPAWSTPGDPAAAWVGAIAEVAGPGGLVTLLSAPGFMEDHQVTAFLAARLRERGCQTHLCAPAQVVWLNGEAHLAGRGSNRKRIDTIVRFYQAEWLPRSSENGDWRYFFRGGKTPVANPAIAVIAESKRFPVVWDRLATRLPAWRALLPETCDPPSVAWRKDDSWLLKASMCNTGDAVLQRDRTPAGQWRKACWTAALQPGKWVVQKRFESAPILTPAGPRHACIGVFTVNGKTVGAYARLARRSVIDFEAQDVALLVDENE